MLGHTYCSNNVIYSWLGYIAYYTYSACGSDEVAIYMYVHYNIPIYNNGLFDLLTKVRRDAERSLFDTVMI